MNSPVITFESQQQAEEYLAYWQEKLFLNNWIIKVNLTVPHEIEEKFDESKEYSGFNSFEPSLCESQIYLLNSFDDDLLTKGCVELSLVHELLHLKLPMFGDGNSIEESLYNSGVHQTLEQLAKSLIMVKYNLSFDWFKNF